MSDSITFLGTSHGNPSRTRYCSSLFFEFSGKNFIIDTGEPVVAQMIRYQLPFSHIEAIFITHAHEDHLGGLPDLLKYFLKYPQNPMPCVYLPEAAVIDPLRNWMKALHIGKLDQLRFAVINPEETLHIGDIEVSFVPTEHMTNAPSNAVVFDNGKKRILFSGDLKADYSDFPVRPGDRHCDYCVTEATHARHNPEKIFARLNIAPVDHFIFNHVGDIWTDGQEYLLEELIKQNRCPAVIAADGMMVQI